MALAARFGIIGILAVLVFGTFRALLMGGTDFSVFHKSWELVLSGHGADIFHATPDRFLYAPGFAWMFAPLGWLPKNFVLFCLCAIKGVCVFHILKIFQRRIRPELPLGFLALGALFAARPLLIDLQYGQVNLLIVWICVMALDCFVAEKSMAGMRRFVVWALMGMVAIIKLLALPLLLVPFLARAPDRVNLKKLKVEAAGIVAGISSILFLPVLTEGFGGALRLLSEWRMAVIGRGFPIESHNQSVIAFFYRALGGEAGFVLALEKKISVGWPWLGHEGLKWLSILWVGLWGIFFLYWLWRGRKITDGFSLAGWAAVLVGLLILPSHLVWKPYFVFSLPIGICIMPLLARPETRFRRTIIILFSLAFLLMNLTSFDLIGPTLAAPLEAVSVMMCAHLVLITVSWRSLVSSIPG